MVGIGYYSASIDYSNLNTPEINLKDETKGEFGAHIGFRLTIPLSNQYRMFGDLRYHFVGYNLKRMENLSLADYKVNANFLSINVGFLLEF